MPIWRTGHFSIEGQGGVIPSNQADLYIANSGTSVRFLTALVALGHGQYRLHGTPRMHERPIQDLIDPLAQLGVVAKCEAGNGCPPVIVHADGLPGGTAKLRGDVSSQFLSGLLMAAPYAKNPVELIVEGALVSQPYVEMTLAVMRSFGVDVRSDRSSAVPDRARQVSQSGSLRNRTRRIGRQLFLRRRGRLPAAKLPSRD